MRNCALHTMPRLFWRRACLCLGVIGCGWSVPCIEAVSQDQLGNLPTATSHEPTSVLNFDLSETEVGHPSDAPAGVVCEGGVCQLVSHDPPASEKDCDDCGCDDVAFIDSTAVVDPLCQSLAPRASNLSNSFQFPWSKLTRDPVTTAVLSVGLVVAGYFLVRLLLRSQGRAMQGSARSAPIQIMASVPLGPRHQLQLVRLATRLVLISATPQSAETLAEITDPLEMEQILEACRAGGPSLAGALDRLSRRSAAVPIERSRNPRNVPRAVFEA